MDFNTVTPPTNYRYINVSTDNSLFREACQNGRLEFAEWYLRNRVDWSYSYQLKNNNSQVTPLKKSRYEKNRPDPDKMRNKNNPIPFQKKLQNNNPQVTPWKKRRYEKNRHGKNKNNPFRFQKKRRNQNVNKHVGPRARIRQ